MLVKVVFCALCILATLSEAAKIGGTPAVPPAKPPASECSKVVYNLTNCISFLTSVKETKPNAMCCNGFKSVLDVGVDCVCAGVKGSSQVGIQLNITRALTLPAACGAPESTEPIRKCALSTPPSAGPAPATPAPPPKQIPSAPKISPVPLAPAPSPSSGAHTISASFATLVTILALYFSSFLN